MDFNLNINLKNKNINKKNPKKYFWVEPISKN